MFNYTRRIRTIGLDELRTVCPSVFCQAKAEHLTDKYEFCSTMPVLQELQANGWHITYARQQGRGYTAKHLLRLMQGNVDEYGWLHLPDADETMELGIFNSHDGSRKLRLICGTRVRACLNGLFASEQALGAVCLKHLTCNSQAIKDALTYFKDNYRHVQEQITSMKNTTIDGADMQNMAIKALVTRWGDLNSAPKTVNSVTLLKANRSSQADNSLWSVFNRIQENITMHRIKDVKAVRSVSEDVRINQSLWDIAVSYIAK
jgi:hypothetical protein